MSEEKEIKTNQHAKPSGVDDARGLSSPKWFIAIVKNRSEKANAEKLTQMGVETYVPIQTEIKRWKNGRKAKVDRVVISNIIFIHCTDQKRKELVTLPFIFRFMTNKAGLSTDSLNKPIAVVSDDEIKKLKFMLGQSDVPVSMTECHYNKGDKVKIIRGSLCGLEGEVFDMNPSQSEMLVRLKYFGCAKLFIDTVNLELIPD